MQSSVDKKGATVRMNSKEVVVSGYWTVWLKLLLVWSQEVRELGVGLDGQSEMLEVVIWVVIVSGNDSVQCGLGMGCWGGPDGREGAEELKGLQY